MGGLRTHLGCPLRDAIEATPSPGRNQFPQLFLDFFNIGLQGMSSGEGRRRIEKRLP